MTVSSLWKAIDRAGCGKPVGAKELQEHSSFHDRTHPWNVNDNRDSKRPALAVDLSIWICEALTCSAFEKCKTDPSLHLVYTRTVKLLNMGIKLVVVIEGKRRNRHQEAEDSFRKRRSGTRFWNACQRCEQMLKLLGVPVVRAKAEGEALCALLNGKGIVDGVISNDGDCLLYGAKVLYTKFTLENLEKKVVMRYDCSNIRACVDDDDGNAYDNERERKEIVTMGRSDLIAFAILTGSDAVGSGLPKVGCRKAIRFIKKCQLDNPLKRENAAMDELKSWARSAAVAKANPVCCSGDEPQAKAKQTCSCCGHSGTKAKHQKYGCALCGTEPGEPCFTLSPGGKFRSAMRKKAMAIDVDFDPESVIKVYQIPNDNQIPLPLLGKSSTTLQMAHPNLQGFLEFPMVIRGQNLFESREYLKQSLSSLMARNELLDTSLHQNTETNTSMTLPSNKTRPEPRRIIKPMIRGGNPSFEVEWIVKATVTDAEGNPMDEFIFSTIEDQQMVKKRYTKLIEDFETREKEQAKQGDAEQEKRRAFLELLCNGCDPKEDSKPKAEGRRATRRCFRDDKKTTCGESETVGPAKSDSHIGPVDMQICFFKCKDDIKMKMGRTRKGERKQHMWGDDADKLLRFIGVKQKMNKEDDCTTICTGICSVENVDRKGSDAQKYKRPSSLTPGHLHFLGGKRKGKCQTAPKSLYSEGWPNDPISENRELEDVHRRRRPIQSTPNRKHCCNSDNHRRGRSCTIDESLSVAQKKTDQTIVRRTRELKSQCASSVQEKHQEAIPSRYARCIHDFELTQRKDLFNSKHQLLSCESLGLNEDYGLKGIDSACQDQGEEEHRKLSPNHHSSTSWETQEPCTADYFMHLQQTARRPHYREEKEENEQAIFTKFSGFHTNNNPLTGDPSFEADCVKLAQYSQGLGLSHRQDYKPSKRRKVEFDSWDENRHLRPSEMDDIHHSRDETISRPSNWTCYSDYSGSPHDPESYDFLLCSKPREEEKFERDHPSMHAYSEYELYTNSNSLQDMNHRHSIVSFAPHWLFRDRSVGKCHGSTGSMGLPKAKDPPGSRRGSSKALDGRVVDDATEKLKWKISSATLDMECSRQLEGVYWLR